MLAFLEGGVQKEWTVRAAWPERVSEDGSGAEKGMGKGLSLWHIWPLPRRPREGPEPHQLGGILGLLGAEDERELLQPMPELLTRGELAADEGQWPQLEYPVKEQRWMGPQLLLGSPACQGARAASLLPTGLTVQTGSQAQPESLVAPNIDGHTDLSRAGTRVGGPR